MKTIQISVTEFASLYGVSGQAVRKQLGKGVLYSQMTGAQKIGNSWIVTVLKSWYDSKIEQR